MTDPVAVAGFAVPQLRGHGVLVRPARGDRVARGPDEKTLRVWRAGSMAAVEIDVREPTDLIVIEPVADIHPWRIESAGVTCAWPHGTALVSDAWERTPFVLELAGEDDREPEEGIWIATAPRSEVEPIERFAVEGQRIRAIGESADGALRIDLDYPHGSTLWWQRKYVLPWSEGLALVVSAQARAKNEETFSLAADLVASTVALARLEA